MQPEQSALLQAAATCIISKRVVVCQIIQFQAQVTTSKTEFLLVPSIALGFCFPRSNHLQWQERRRWQDTRRQPLRRLMRMKSSSGRAGRASKLYSNVLPIAEHMLAAPASRAFV